MFNIFEEPILAIRPVASKIKKIMLELGAVNAMMSGSGPSVFGIFESESNAKLACEKIKSMGIEPKLCHPVTP